MFKQVFRVSTVLLVLAYLLLFLSTSPVWAASRAEKGVHQFSPTGHSQALPRRVSTDSVPQIKGSGSGTIAARPAPGGRNRVPAPTHVVQLPAPPKGFLSTKTSFDGQGYTGWVPSDSNGAGGLNNYIETVNEQFEVYSRSGLPQYGTSFNSWFGQSGSLFDPKVIWDNSGNRFIFMVDTGSSLLISVAQQTSGTGSYCTYSFPTLTGYFADYPQLGVNLDGVYFSANLYPNSGGNVIPQLFFANRSEMESCQGTSYTYWTGLTNPDGSYAFTIVPSVEHTYGGVEYMVNSNPGGACQVTIWWLYNDSSLYNFNLPTQCYSPPPPAKQAGSAGTIETLDNRLYQAGYINGTLNFDTVGSYDWGDGNGQVGIVEWFQVNPSSLVVTKQGSFGTPGYWNFFPAMDETGPKKLLFIYDSSGPSIDPSIWMVSGCLCDLTTLVNGGSYFGTSGTARWGDFQSAWLDPKPSSTGKLNAVWITGQYANASNSWSTRVARIVPHT